MSAATIPWLQFVPLAVLAAAFFSLFLTLAKKHLDSDKEIIEKVETVVSRNREVLRQRLQYLADDLTNAKSEYSLKTLSNEAIVQSRTFEILKCFKRMTKCRRRKTTAYIFCETAMWSAYTGYALIITFVLASIFLPNFVRYVEIVGGLCACLCLIGMFIADRCFSTIRSLHASSESLDASLPS